MSNPLILDDSFGYARVTVKTAAGDQTATLDLWESNNRYCALQQTHAADTVALGAAWCGYLADKGLPGLSHGAAFRVFGHVQNEMNAAKKNGSPSPTPDSPGSTGPPPSDSPAP